MTVQSIPGGFTAGERVVSGAVAAAGWLPTAGWRSLEPWRPLRGQVKASYCQMACFDRRSRIKNDFQRYFFRMLSSLSGFSTPSWVWTISPRRSRTTVKGSAITLLPNVLDNSIAPNPPTSDG